MEVSSRQPTDKPEKLYDTSLVNSFINHEYYLDCCEENEEKVLYMGGMHATSRSEGVCAFLLTKRK